MMDSRLLLFCMKAMERRRVREPEPSLLRRLDKLLFCDTRAAPEPLGEREALGSKELVRSGCSLQQNDTKRLLQVS